MPDTQPPAPAASNLEGVTNANGQGQGVVYEIYWMSYDTEAPAVLDNEGTNPTVEARLLARIPEDPETGTEIDLGAGLDTALDCGQLWVRRLRCDQTPGVVVVFDGIGTRVAGPWPCSAPALALA